MNLILFVCLLLVTGAFSGDPIPIGTKGNYIYKNAVHASLLFYETQRAGKLPKSNRISWRGDSMLNDGKDVGKDLTGGYFDAGDLVKFGFPMAFTMTLLTWGLLDYEDEYRKAGELKNMRKAIKWGTDYFIKCHSTDNEFYGQVGNGDEDHAVWSRPEDWPTDKVRPSYKVTTKQGGSDLLGETAAALAAASIAFKKVDSLYSTKLLHHAKSLYKFADKYRQTYTVEITDAVKFYKSFSGFGDELAWAAAWLLRATEEKFYIAELEKHFKEFQELNYNPGGFGWDTKTAGVQTLLAKITGEDKYKEMVKNFCDSMLQKEKTPKGLTFLGEWGSLRSVANVAFICLQAANIGINANEYRNWSESQIGYILGDTGRSFVVGVGVNAPTQPHHRGSSCPDSPSKCDYNVANRNGPNYQTLYGALVGGPDANDKYNDSRADYVHNEVACDYNAGFQSAVVAIMHYK